MTAVLMTRFTLAVIAFVLVGWMLPWSVPGGAPPVAAATVTFRVNSTADSHDAHPGNGKCADSAGRCTLRAAVEAANAEPAGTSVSIKVPAGQYPLTLGSLDLTGNTIAITGAGSGAIAGTGTGSTVVQATGAFRVVNVGAAATATLSQLTITGGNAGNTGYGGGVFSAGKLTISLCVIKGNKAVAGGGILNGQNGHPAGAHSAAAGVRPACPPVRHCAGGPGRPGAGRPPTARLRLIVTGTDLASNTSSNAGGGIANDGGVAVVTGSTLTGNSAGLGIGGGIQAFGSLTVDLSTLSGNKASSGGGIEAFNGHVAVPSRATVEQSTLSGNKASVGGGIDANTTVTVTASTLTANNAGQGAGIEVEGGVTIGVLNSTLTGNVGAGIDTFQCGGGTVGYSTIDANEPDLSLSCSTLQLTGTIVAGSTATANCAGAAPSETVGYNLDSGTSCGFAKSTDLTKTNPLLGKLAANGGPTMTQTLRRGSPAINRGGTGATGCPATDQRGLPRPFGPACDIGSMEVHHK